MTTTAVAPDASPGPEDWPEANQRHLVAAVAEVRAALERHRDVPPAARIAHERPARLSPPAALDRVTEAFGLTRFERAVLVLCAGVELDASLASLCGNGPTFGLALAALDDAHWSAVTPDAPLRRWQLVELPSSGPLTNATLRVDEHVLHVLSGVGGTDPKLRGLVTPDSSRGDTTSGQIPAAHRLGDLWRIRDSPVAILSGADRESRIAVAAHAARDLSMSLALLDVRVLPADPGTREELARLLERDSVLSSRAFLMECDADTMPAADALLSLTAAPMVVSATDPPALQRSSTLIVDVPRPTAHEQRELWQSLAGDGAPVDALVAAFDLSCSTIRSAALAAAHDPAAIWTACRAIDRPDLSAHAQRIDSGASWDDLVVAPAQRQALGLLTAHARHRVTVFDEWGMRMGRTTGLGSTAVFGGPSGTGKTFAAEVIANDLELDLYRVDLSAVVSKYIGETEKNLRRVFDAADHGAAVLLFDEADALFGKRTEVKDSHDRYANVEVSYLLQRMEAYRGLAILTTNMADAIDTAFLRRVRFLVSFPFPDQEMRVELWRRAFPASTPTSGLDVDALAQLDLAGGTIRNVAVNAAFLAAESGGVVTMAHVIQAARIEAGKLGQPMPSVQWEASS